MQKKFHSAQFTRRDLAPKLVQKVPGCSMEFFEEVHQYSLSLPKDDKYGYIITSPEKALSIPYIDRQFLDAGKKAIDTELMVPPCPRGKGLLLLVRGSGGGKTRYLEELRKGYSLEKDSLCLAITFNSFWCYIKAAELRIEDNDSLSFALSVISRIISVQEKVWHESITRFIKKEFSLSKETSAELLLADFFSFMVASQPQGGKNIQKLIVMVDEIVAVQKNFVEGSINCLHRALLNDRIPAFPDLSSAVIISSLKINPTMETSYSRRPLIPLSISEYLNEEEVCSNWFFNLNRNKAANEWYKLKVNRNSSEIDLLVNSILCFNSLPREIEYFVDFFDNKLATTANVVIDSKFINEAWKHVANMMSYRYPSIPFPSAAFILKLLNGKLVQFTEETSNLLESGIIINSLIETTELESFFPKINMVSLNYLTTTDESPVGVCLKLTCMAETGRHLSLSEFLRFENMDTSDLVDPEFIYRLNILKIPPPAISVKIQHSKSYQDGGESIMHEISEIKVSEKFPVVVFKPPDGECFDLLLVIYDRTKPNMPYLLPLEMKAKYHDTTEMPIPLPTQFSLNQSVRFHQLVEKIPVDKLPFSPTLLALQKRNYNYLYFTTVNCSDYSAANGTVIVGRDTAIKSVSVFFPNYHAFRSTDATRQLNISFVHTFSHIGHCCRFAYW
jgi:hypothetical protein